MINKLLLTAAFGLTLASCASHDVSAPINQKTDAASRAGTSVVDSASQNLEEATPNKAVAGEAPINQKTDAATRTGTEAVNSASDSLKEATPNVAVPDEAPINQKTDAATRTQ